MNRPRVTTGRRAAGRPAERISAGPAAGILVMRTREGVIVMKGILVLSGSGPLLILSSYPTIDDPLLIAKLRAKGLAKFLAWEVPVDHLRDLYGYTFRDIVEQLETRDDMRVLDFDGHRIFLNLSLRDLGQHILFEDQHVLAER